MKRAEETAETAESAYIAGCDGAHSVVREALHIGFPGGAYTHVFYGMLLVFGAPLAPGNHRSVE